MSAEGLVHKVVFDFSPCVHENAGYLNLDARVKVPLYGAPILVGFETDQIVYCVVAVKLLGVFGCCVRSGNGLVVRIVKASLMIDSTSC